MALDEGLLTIEELSAYLNIKVSSLYAKAERNEIPVYKIGNLLRFRKSEVDAWLQTVKREPQRPSTQGSVRRTHCRNEDVDGIVRRAIAETKPLPYIPSQGKPDRIEGLRKEVYDEDQGSL
jgi:excisionase family DNA binding protein